MKFDWTEALIFNGVFVTVWLLLAVLETTIKEVKIDNGKVLFIIQRRLRKDDIIKFKMASFSIELKNSHSKKSHYHILTINDGINKLAISSEEKGISAETLREIAKKLSSIGKA